MLGVRGKITVGVLCLHGTAATEKVLRPSFFFRELRYHARPGVVPKGIKLERAGDSARTQKERIIFQTPFWSYDSFLPV